mmetsp:Transcript_25418/g.79637  ORF Transcript_25418/g.79637 Transcript_25418/m.79637 type:complete len:229 (-) Transcript_25418:587-1273(-)
MRSTRAAGDAAEDDAKAAGDEVGEGYAQLQGHELEVDEVGERPDLPVREQSRPERAGHLGPGLAEDPSFGEAAEGIVPERKDKEEGRKCEERAEGLVNSDHGERLGVRPEAPLDLVADGLEHGELVVKARRHEEGLRRHEGEEAREVEGGGSQCLADEVADAHQAHRRGDLHRDRPRLEPTHVAAPEARRAARRRQRRRHLRLQLGHNFRLAHRLKRELSRHHRRAAG